MNRQHRTLWNDKLGAFVAAPETNTARGKRSSGRTARCARHALALAAAAATVGLAHAGPQGGQVSAGSGSIHSAGATTTITQTSPRLSINWQGFNTTAGETVNFLQPSSSAVALNRVLGSDGTQFLGKLNANGQVFVINPNGVLFGKSAQVSVGGLVASTLSLGDVDFMAGKPLRFSGIAQAGSVDNQGSLSAADGGYVALLGGRVSNSGTINARLGSVALAAGRAVTLDFAGDGLLGVAVDQGELNALVANSGSIVSDGGSALLTAKAAGELIGTVVNNTGVIQARTLQNRAGVIKLLGDFAGGTVAVSGTLDASAPGGGDGGFIDTSGATVKVADGTRVSTLALQGKTGQWLIDPADYTVAASGGDISGATLSASLASSHVTLQSASGAQGGSGNVNIDDNVSWRANTLTLTAAKDVNINAVMNASGTAALALNPATANGADAAVPGGTVNVLMGSGKVNFGGSAALSVNGVRYIILNSASQLSDVNNGLASRYALGADLDASSLSGFVPIGTGSTTFRGVFDGLGHTISNLTITGVNRIALFEFSAGTLRNLGLLGASVSGFNGIGGLVAINSGTVDNVYVTGTVSGAGLVGGLVGINQGTISKAYFNGAVSGSGDGAGGLVGFQAGGTLSHAYATGSVSGGTSVGGLVGDNGGTVSQAYTTAAVSGTAGVGGLVGSTRTGGAVTGSFWDIPSTGQATSAGGTGLGTAQLQAALPSGFSSSIWGNANNQSTPYLLGNPGPARIVTDSSNTLYQIVVNATQLQNINGAPGQNYALGNSIDLGSIRNFEPLGNVIPFSGTFDGLNFTLSNLSINRAATEKVGLFGTNSGLLRNVGLAGGSVIGTRRVGALAGQNNGAIDNVFATGAVSGSAYVGGLVGANDGTISNAYATGTVSGSGFSVGGLVGENFFGTISNAYATGSVSGDRGVGGLIGNKYADSTQIINAYATGAVSGRENVGGLIGFLNGGGVINTYATGPVSGQLNVGGLVGGAAASSTVSSSFWDMQTTGRSTSALGSGLSTAQMQSLSTFAQAGWSIDKVAGSGSTWRIYDGQTAPLLRSFLAPLTVTDAVPSVVYNGDTQSRSLASASLSVAADAAKLFHGDITGIDAGSYRSTMYSNQSGYDISDSRVLTITPKPVTASATAQNKVYDGSAAATAAVAVGGLYARDAILVSSGSAAFTDKNVASAKPVSVDGISLSGTGAGNYRLTSSTARTTADITPKGLTVSGYTAANKVYDGNTTATITTSGATLNGKVTGDTVAVSGGSGSFADKNAGTARTVTVTGYALSGADAANYAVAANSTTTANITPKALTVSGVTANDKAYDGNTTATFNLGRAVLTGKVSGDSVTLATLTGRFSNQTIGFFKPVTVTGNTFSGADAGNYTLTVPTGLRATIWPSLACLLDPLRCVFP